MTKELITWSPAECGLEMVKSDKRCERFTSFKPVSSYSLYNYTDHSTETTHTFEEENITINIDALGFILDNQLSKEEFAVLKRILTLMDMIYIKNKIVGSQKEYFFYKQEGSYAEKLPYDLNKTEYMLEDILGYTPENFKTILKHTVALLSEKNKKIMFIERTGWSLKYLLSEYGEWDKDYRTHTGCSTLLKEHYSGFTVYRRLGVGIV